MTESYQNLLQTFLIPEEGFSYARNLFSSWFGLPYPKDGSFFFLEGAWCQDHFPCFWSKEVWPSSSPDLKVMDCCVQSLLEADACASLYGLVEAQKHSLLTVWAKMPQETLRKAAEGFHSRLKCVIQARKGPIE